MPPLLLAAIFGIGSGCGKQPVKGQLPTFSTRGIVKIDGQPSRRAVLQLTPVDLTTGHPGASGQVGEDGKFVLQTYAPNDGVPKGSYKVTLGPDFAKFMPVPAVAPLTIEIKEANSNLELNFQGTGQGNVGLQRPETK